MKILVIDDDQFLMLALIGALKSQGHQVYGASNGAKGLSMIRRLHPDLIFCDIVMPIMNGMQVRQQLRQDPELANIPFIFVSGRDNPQDIDQGLALGAEEYLIKPIRLQTVVDCIHRHEELNGSRIQQSVANHQ